MYHSVLRMLQTVTPTSRYREFLALPGAAVAGGGPQPITAAVSS